MEYHAVIDVLAGLLSVLVISEGALVHPTRHTYPTTGLQSVNGSASNGGCTNSSTTSVTGLSLCHSGNSSLVDGVVPTLPPSLVGENDWSAGLFTVNRNGEAFIEIGFDFGRFVELTQIELDLFNCPEWYIAAPSISVYSYSLFPAMLPPRTIITHIGSVTTLNSTSCDSITTVLIPLQQTVNTRIYYLEFTFDNAPNVQWVHLAEIRFFDSTPPTPTTNTMSTATGTQPTLLHTMQPTSSIPPTVTVSVTGTILQTVQPTSRPSMTSGEGNRQTCSSDIVAGIMAVAVTMGVLNIIFIAVIVMLVVALVKRGKRQVSDSAVYYDVQKSSKVEMKDNKAYGHSTMKVAETVPGCKAEYEEVGREQVTGGNQGGGIEMKKNEVYAQPGGNNTH